MPMPVQTREAYLYQQENNGSITLLDTFIGSDTANWDKYGAHVSLYGNHMLIGSYESDPLGPLNQVRFS